MHFGELNEKNLVIYAAKHYYNPKCIDADDFYDDLKRFNYLKRLITKYKQNNDLSERLILNHLIVIFNVFGIPAGLKMLEYKIGIQNWSIIKPFLIKLGAIENTEYSEYEMDSTVVKALRTI